MSDISCTACLVATTHLITLTEIHRALNVFHPGGTEFLLANGDEIFQRSDQTSRKDNRIIMKYERDFRDGSWNTDDTCFQS